MILRVSEGGNRRPQEVMPEKRVFRSARSSALSAQPSSFSVRNLEGPEMKVYPVPKTRMEWSSDRRDLLEILGPGPQRFQPMAGSNSEVGLTLPTFPELPTPQREGLKLIDRSRGYEYTLKTHIVPRPGRDRHRMSGIPQVLTLAGCEIGGHSQGSERRCWR